MSWDRAGILSKATSYSAYTRGFSLYREGNLYITNDEQISFFEYIFKGAVLDGVETFYTRSHTIKDEILPSSCSCGRGREGLCPHQVAVALMWLDKHGKRDENEIVATDSDFTDMIGKYIDQLDEEYRTLSENNNVILHLEPTLIIDRNQASASFKIGDNKLYVLKCVEDLYDAYNNHTVLNYGKFFNVIPEKNDFKGYDALMFDLIMKKSSEYLKNINYRFSYQTHRSVSLNIEDVDTIILPKNNSSLNVSYHNKTKEFHVVIENPSMTFGFDDKKKNGATLIINDLDWNVLKGREHLYVLKDDKIYICDEDYSKDCKNFLTTLNSYREDGRTRIDIYKEDLKNFFLNVYPKIEKHIKLDMDNVSITDYIPKQLKAKFYLDMPDRETLTLLMNFSYGDETFNPLEAVSVSSGRDSHKEKLIGNVVGKYFNGMDEKYHLTINKNDDKLFDFLKNGINELKLLGEVYVTDAVSSTKVVNRPKVNVGVSVKSDLLNVKISADGMDGADLKTLLSEYKLRKRYHRLKDGSFIDMGDDSSEELSRVSELVDGLNIKDKSVSDLYLPMNRAFYLANTLEDDDSFTADTDYKKLIEEFKNDSGEEYEVPEDLQATLRDYQITGYSWLKRLSKYGFGAILADDMGLGKTIQVITLLLDAKAPGKTSLICTPASLVYNWKCEFDKFAPSMKVVCVLGDSEVREGIINSYKDYDVLITSYDVLRRDTASYEGKHFCFQIVDEAQFIKNQNTQKAQSVKAIEADTKIALTGTPIENRLSELWSIFDYLMNGYLSSYQSFKINYEQPIVKEDDEDVLKKLKKLIAPFILRRLKKDVLTSLPDKIEEVVYSEIEGEQKKLYNATEAQLIGALSGQSENDIKKNKIQILAQLTRLRQLCCDPGLVYDNYNGGSAKLDTCMELITQAVEGGHKILLFSQFTSMLYEIEKKLQENRISYYILTGETPIKTRAELVDLFNKDETRVFLISLKAGGTGLNLTAADIVIHYDPWWNIAAQNQATDRSHRIGQENNVNVYKLIAKDTIEDRILTLQKNKQKLSDDLLGEDVSTMNFDKDELLNILKKA